MNKRTREARELSWVNCWNRQVKKGDPVSVRLDSGETMETVTKSEAWMLGGHTGVILVEGISGCYALSRCRPSAALPVVDPEMEALFKAEQIAFTAKMVRQQMQNYQPGTEAYKALETSALHWEKLLQPQPRTAAP
jgi:hypothetical protein